MSYDSISNSGRQGCPVRAKVKWMNDAKGFGFVVPEGASSDAFIHVTVLRRVGVETLGEGAEILCTIGPGPKGPQVLDVLEIFSRGALSSSSASSSPFSSRGFAGKDRGSSFSSPSRARSFASGASMPTEDVTGTVKWYKPEKGFGFIIPDGGGKDIFVHKACLDRAGVTALSSGQKVRASVKPVPRGLEVVTLFLLD